MSRLSDLLVAVGTALRDARDDADAKIFTEVRVELDRFDLADLLKDSTRTPTARVCFMRAKPVARSDGGYDRDVSLAIVVVAGRSGRASPNFSSADLTAINLLDACSDVLIADPYVGLGRLQEAELGDQLVALSEQSNDKGFAIALMEVKWRLLDVSIGRPALQAAIETGRNPLVADQVAINDGPAEPAPLGYTPPVVTP